MSTRIRYDKEGTTLVSRRIFTLPDNRQVKVSLDTSSMKYTISDAVSGDVLVVDGKTKNLAVLKIQAKAALKTLGYDFSEEKRNRA